MANINNIDIKINEDDKKKKKNKSKETELTKKNQSSGKIEKRVSAMMAARHFS